MLANFFLAVLGWGVIVIIMGGLVVGGIWLIKSGINDLNTTLPLGLFQIILGCFSFLCEIIAFCMFFHL